MNERLAGRLERLIEKHRPLLDALSAFDRGSCHPVLDRLAACPVHHQDES